MIEETKTVPVVIEETKAAQESIEETKDEPTLNRPDSFASDRVFINPVQLNDSEEKKESKMITFDTDKEEKKVQFTVENTSTPDLTEESSSQSEEYDDSPTDLQ